MPTREEAIGIVIAAALSPGKKLAGIFKGQASKIASIIKTIEEKAKEKEAAAPAAAKNKKEDHESTQIHTNRQESKSK